jgi:hypothetical protein
MPSTAFNTGVTGQKVLAAIVLLVISSAMPLAAFADEFTANGPIVRLSPLSSSNTYGAANTTSQSGGNTYPTYSGNYSTDSLPLKGHITTIPKDALMTIKLDQPISSYSSRLGDPVIATLDNNVYSLNDSVAVPAGSQVMGQITKVSPSGHLGKHGELEMTFFSIRTPDGNSVPIVAKVVTSDKTGVLRTSTYTKDILTGVGTTAGGTITGLGLGAAAGGVFGQAVGGMLLGMPLGAAVAGGYALARKGQDIVLPPGSRLGIKMEQPVTVNP